MFSSSVAAEKRKQRSQWRSAAVSRRRKRCSSPLSDMRGDCGAIVDGLSPAVLLLTNLCARNPDELYPPAAVLEYVSDRWTPELGVNVLRRTISDASERSPRTWS